MKTANILASVIVALGCTLLASCKAGRGPLLINVSGETARLLIRVESGETYDGTCENQDAVWVGRSGVDVTRVEIQMPSTRYILEGEELLVPYGKDRTTAFLIETSGPRKLTLDEAEILMRDRPE